MHAIFWPAAFLLVGVGGQSEADLFRLFNDCRPTRLLVETLTEDALEIGLTRERLLDVAEGRLRSARLFTSDQIESDFSYVYINVNVVAQAYSVSFRYNKTVTDQHGQLGFAGTWFAGTDGTHGDSPEHIVSVVSDLVDRFTLAYLRVNEDACGGPGQ